MKREKKKISLKFFLLGIIVFFFILEVFILIKDFSRSLFLNNKERINIVFYGDDSYFFSLDREGKINYKLYLPPDLRLVIPGGYGIYRLGGLGKLVSLEKKPEIFKKTFSLATSSFIDYFFYSKKNNVYYGFDKKDVIYRSLFKRLISDQSNANFFDRLYLFFYFLRTPAQSYISLPLVYDKNKIFNENEFFKNTQGYFYHKRLRQEDLNLQIIYNQSYKTALAIASIIEGQGIRVNDLTQKNKKEKDCFILKNNKNNSYTTLVLSYFFNCQVKQGDTTPYDIILILNDEENNWLY